MHFKRISSGFTELGIDQRYPVDGCLAGFDHVRVECDPNPSCQRDLPVRYRPTPSSTSESGEETQQPPTIASYFIYGICGALAPILLVLGLKLSGLSGGH